MTEMATELRGLRSPPAAIQRTFDQQRSEAKRKGPIQRPNHCWHFHSGRYCTKRIRKSDLSHRPQLNAGCSLAAAFAQVHVRVDTPRHFELLQDPPQPASTTTSVSSDRAGVLDAIESSLASADNSTRLSLSSGFTVPIEAKLRQNIRVSDALQA